MRTAPPPDNLPVATEPIAPVLSEDAIRNRFAFLACVERIIRRLLAEGYLVQDGLLVNPSERLK